jgi:hypothetical protein
MGDYRNGWLTNSIMGILILIALWFTYQNAVTLWTNLDRLT